MIFLKNLYYAKTNLVTAEFDLSRAIFTDVVKLNDAKREKLEGKITYMYDKALTILKEHVK